MQPVLGSRTYVSAPFAYGKRALKFIMLPGGRAARVPGVGMIQRFGRGWNDVRHEAMPDVIRMQMLHTTARLSERGDGVPTLSCTSTRC